MNINYYCIPLDIITFLLTSCFLKLRRTLYYKGLTYKETEIPTLTTQKSYKSFVTLERNKKGRYYRLQKLKSAAHNPQKLPTNLL